MSDTNIRLSVSGAAQVTQAFDSVRRSMVDVESAASSVRSALGSIGASLSVAAMASFVKQTIDGIDALNDLKDATGASIENISALEDVARRTGAGIDTVGTALIKLNQGLSNAKPGTDAARAFSALGLSIKELKALDPAEAMLKTADALSGFADDANKARLVQELFGKSMKEVAPLLKDLAEAGELNAKVTTDQADEAEKFNKQLFNLQKNSIDAARGLVSGLLPTLNALTEEFTKSGDAAGTLSNILGKGIRVALESVAILVTDVTFVIKGMGREIGGIVAQFSAMGDAGGIFTQAGRDAWNTVGEAMRQDAKQARQELDDLQARILGFSRINEQAQARLKRQGATAVDKPSARDITGDDAAAKAKAAAASAAAAALKKQQDLLEKLSGYTSSYSEDANILRKMLDAGTLSQQSYNGAINELVNTQPGVKAALDERAKALDTYVKAGVKAYEEEVKAHDEYIKSLNTSAESVAKQVQKLQDEEQAAGIAAAQNISLAQAIEQVELARLDETYAKVASEGADGQVLLALQKEIEARRKLVGLVGDKEARDANAKGAKDAADEWKKTSNTINQSLTDALMRGWESGKSFAENFRDTVVNMFKTLVLQPVISAIVSPVSMGITGMMGLSSAANAAGAGGVDAVNGASAAINGASMLSGMKGWLTDFGGGVASQVSKLGNTLAQSSSEMLQGWGKNIADNATSIGKYANYAGYAMAAISALDAASKGKWGQAVGTGVGAIWGPLGSMVGGAVGSWVDNAFGGGHEYTTGSGVSGSFSGSGFSGRNYQDWRNDGSSGFFGIGGSGSSSGTNYSAMATAQSKAFGIAFAGIKNQTADFAKALGLSADTVQGFSKDIRVSLGSDAEANKAAIAAMFKGIADAAAATVLDAQYIREGEAAADTLARLATNLTIVNGSFDTLGKTLLATSQAGGDVASSLIDQMGGLQAFQSSMSAYYQAYYSDEERLAKTREQTAAAFSSLGIAMPDTLQAFRDLVTAQDISTASGRNAYAALINLSGAFASITSTVDPLTESLVQVAKSIKSLTDSIGTERTAVAGSASSITPSPVMSLAGIFSGIRDSQVSQPSYTAAISANSALSAADAAKALALGKSANANQVMANAQAALNSASAYAAALPSTFDAARQQLYDAGNRHDIRANSVAISGGAIDRNHTAYQYNAATNRLSSYDYNSYWGHGLSEMGQFRAEYGNAVNILDGANAQLAASEVALAKARSDATAAQGPAAEAALAAKNAIELQAAASASAAKAWSEYQTAVEKFAIDASKSVPKLAKLREETLRYYESQKALSEQMIASSSNLRQAVATAKSAQLDSAQLLAQRRRDFATSYSMALSTTGSVQASYADKLASALPDLAAGLMDTASSRSEWVVATQSLYAQSEQIAAMLADAAPKDYQAESLSALTAIDNTLAVLDDSTRAITRAIESSSGLTAAGLRQVVTALGGTPSFDVGTNYVPRNMFARIHEGEAVVPRAYNPAAGARTGGGMSNTERLEALVERQAQEMEGMRAELRSIAVSSMSTAKILRDVTPNRTSLATVAA